MTPLFARLLDALDRRTGVRKPLASLAGKTFPRHWSFLLGEVAVVCFGVLVLTGIFLTAFYRPSTDPVVYTGSADLFAGREMPGAFTSIVHLSHDVPGGLLVRRVHRAAAQLFIASMVLHLLRVVLTGAFRRPREPQYLAGIALLLLGVASGYSGHNLIFDVLAGTSLRILYTFLLAVPYAGEALAQWIFGGEFPTGQMIPRLYVVHVLVLPALIAALTGIHLLLVFRQTHTQYPHRVVDVERAVTGGPLWPSQAATSLTMALSVCALLAVAAVLVPWSDVDLHGPYLLAQASNASQPDWFLFWVEGALRLYPPLEFSLLGTTVSGPLVAGVILPLVTVAVLFAYPAIERLVAGDPWPRHVAQRAYDVPFRAGAVAAFVTFMLVLTAAAGNDVLARQLAQPIERVVWTLRVAALAGPVVAAAAAVVWARRRSAPASTEAARSVVATSAWTQVSTADAARPPSIPSEGAR